MWVARAAVRHGLRLPAPSGVLGRTPAASRGLRCLSSIAGNGNGAATAPVDDVFDKLLKNIVARHDHGQAGVFKSLLDLTDDKHFRFEPHHVDLTLHRLGVNGAAIQSLDPLALAVHLVANNVRRAYLFFDRSVLNNSEPLLPARGLTTCRNIAQRESSWRRTRSCSRWPRSCRVTSATLTATSVRSSRSGDAPRPSWPPSSGAPIADRCLLIGGLWI